MLANPGNKGKTIFAQPVELVPWTCSSRIVVRYSGDARVSTPPNTEHLRLRYVDVKTLGHYRAKVTFE